MITLRADRLHWISDDGSDEPSDICAHSPVSFQISDHVISSPDDGDWTVSASAIYLLRALDRDHTHESSVGDHIFPCCGHSIYDVGEPEVVICGCPSGIDFEIRRIGDEFQLTTDDKATIAIPERVWRSAVLTYSEQIMAFYDQASLKQPDEGDREGFIAMMSEWRRLHNKHKEAESGPVTDS